jgi:hypothetical protein
MDFQQHLDQLETASQRTTMLQTSAVYFTEQMALQRAFATETETLTN